MLWLLSSQDKIYNFVVFRNELQTNSLGFEKVGMANNYFTIANGLTASNFLFFCKKDFCLFKMHSETHLT